MELLSITISIPALTMTSRPAVQEYVVAAVGVAVGVICMMQTNAATQPWMDPKVEACTQGDYTPFERMLRDDIVPYSPELGGGFVCIITQFLNALAENYPGGLLTWGGVTLVSFPFTVIGAIEAGRFGAKGPVRYSVIMALLSQFLGVCVIMPALWVPSYVFGGSKDGPFHPSRPMASVYLSIPFTVLAIAIFALDPTTATWRHCAGILGGPLIALLPMAYYFSPAPTDVKDMKMNSEAAKASYVKAYQCMGILSLAGWIVMVYTAWTVYGLDLYAVANGLWYEAHLAVKFMTIDTMGFFIATLLYAYLRSPSMFGKALLLTPLLGPGAALCFVLAQTGANYVVPKEKQ